MEMTTFVALAQEAAASQKTPSILDFFLLSGPMAKVVLAILIAFSLGSWAIILNKFFHFRKADEHTRAFLRLFHKSNRFSEVNAATQRLSASPLVGIFQAGYAEIDTQVKATREAGEHARYTIQSLSSVERSLKRAVAVELASLGRGSYFLGTTAAATPFIGLFGTVWGIMIAFGEIGASNSTSIVTVAPGIAEALVNTAAGLAAAIPALVAYNYFAQRLRGARAQMEDFCLEFINLAERNFT